MTAKSLTYRTIPPEWRDTSKWREVDVSALDSACAERFHRLSKAVSLYMRGGKLKHAADAAGCSGPTLIDQIRRCLTVQLDGSLFGWAGLIEGLRTKDYQREAPLPSGDRAAARGSAGAFKKFLQDHPSLKKDIDEAIVRGVGTRNARALKSTVRSVFKLFLRKLAEAGHPVDQYPLNSKSRGRRSLERYVKFKLDTDPKTVRSWCGPDAAKALQVGNGRFVFELAAVPLALVGADAHVQDCIGVVRIMGPAGPQLVPVQRLWIYAYADVEGRAVLGYAVAIRDEANGAMLETAVDMSQRPWKKRELKMHDVHYSKTAGFPNGSVEGFTACRPAAFRLDNGMPGFSLRMADRVRRKLGCAISFGSIGGWWHNAVIERIFLRLEQCGFHFFPSSTGSHPKDPMRGDACAEAVKHNIEWHELIDLVDVAFANYNGERQAGLGYRSPLEVLREASNPDTGWVQFGHSLPATVSTPQLGIAIETRTIRGKRDRGAYRHAYVQIDKCDYTNDAIANRIDLVGTPLTVHIPDDLEGDMRSIRAFLPSGEPIGELTVRNRGWRRTKHSREMRKVINRLRDAGDLAFESEDYPLDYLAHLAAKAVEDARNRPGKVSRAASELAEASRTTGEPIPHVKGAPRLRLVKPTARPVPSHIKRPSWG